jgi:hypothetical protein
VSARITFAQPIARTSFVEGRLEKTGSVDFETGEVTAHVTLVDSAGSPERSKSVTFSSSVISAMRREALLALGHAGVVTGDNGEPNGR